MYLHYLGNGKYGIYLANYAARSNGVQVGAHTILEMDESRSSGNKIFLKNVGEEAGVQQFTGEITLQFDHYIWSWSLDKCFHDKQKDSRIFENF